MTKYTEVRRILKFGLPFNYEEINSYCNKLLLQGEPELTEIEQLNRVKELIKQARQITDKILSDNDFDK